MQDIITRVQALTRPPLLVRAARHGTTEYRRESHLPRILRCDPAALPGHGAALVRLLEAEAAQDEKRRAGIAGYALPRHVDLLIALMAEARAFMATRHRVPRDRATPDPHAAAMCTDVS